MDFHTFQFLFQLCLCLHEEYKKMKYLLIICGYPKLAKWRQQITHKWFTVDIIFLFNTKPGIQRHSSYINKNIKLDER